MLPSSSDFFQTKRSLSEIKAELLPAFFQIWAQGTTEEELVLADLNAGAGLEANGEKSVALQLREAFQETENATENEAKTLNLFLSDVARSRLEKLQLNLLLSAGEDDPRLPENICLLNEAPSQETLFKKLQKLPGLLVADPFSYAQAQEIISEAMQNTNAGLFLLFEYKKLEKTFLAENHSVLLQQLFGETHPEIKAQLQLQKSARLREQFLTEHFKNGFRKKQFYPLLFRINPPGKAGNAVYLLLAGKDLAGYFKAKEFLKSYSEVQEDGVPLFGVNLNYQPSSIPGFSAFMNPFSLKELSRELAGQKAEFHYQTIREIYEAHSPGTNYVLANYVAAFRDLCKAGTVNLVDHHNKKVLKASPETVVFYRLHRSPERSEK